MTCVQSLGPAWRKARTDTHKHTHTILTHTHKHRHNINTNTEDKFKRCKENSKRRMSLCVCVSSWNKHPNTNERGRKETSLVDWSQVSSGKASIPSLVCFLILYSHKVGQARESFIEAYAVSVAGQQPGCLNCFSRLFCSRWRMQSCLPIKWYRHHFKQITEQTDKYSN